MDLGVIGTLTCSEYRLYTYKGTCERRCIINLLVEYIGGCEQVRLVNSVLGIITR